MLEAMAVGCVPIVTDLPVNHEWIEPGTNGLIFPVGDDERLVEMIVQATVDSRWREEVVRRNRELIRSRALWRDNMSAVEEAMRHTIGSFRDRKTKAGH
jgi:glycosyltransferase involved in cell wall biosynthesis